MLSGFSIFTPLSFLVAGDLALGFWGLAFFRAFCVGVYPLLAETLRERYSVSEGSSSS
jgi:hypothetical protein